MIPLLSIAIYSYLVCALVYLVDSNFYRRKPRITQVQEIGPRGDKLPGCFLRVFHQLMRVGVIQF